jgi:hypothetical protein
MLSLKASNSVRHQVEKTNDQITVKESWDQLHGRNLGWRQYLFQIITIVLIERLLKMDAFGQKYKIKLDALCTQKKYSRNIRMMYANFEKL